MININFVSVENIVWVHIENSVYFDTIQQQDFFMKISHRNPNLIKVIDPIHESIIKSILE